MSLALNKIPIRFSPALLGLLALLILLLVIFVFTQVNTKEGKGVPVYTPTPKITEALGVPPVTVLKLENVVPGFTKEDELGQVENQFATRQINGKTHILVGQDQSSRYSTIELQNGIVKAVVINDRQRFQFSVFREYLNFLGNPKVIVYGPWQESGFRSYVYLSQGLIIIAHQATGEVIEIWNIERELSLEQFLQQFGDRFSTSPEIGNRF